MSFSHNSRTLRSGKRYTQNIHPKMSPNVGNLNSASRQSEFEEINDNNYGFHPKFLKEGLGLTWNPLLNKSQTLLSKLINSSTIIWRKLFNGKLACSPPKHITLALQGNWCLENLARHDDGRHDDIARHSVILIVERVIQGRLSLSKILPE